MKREELTPIELECNMGPDVNGVVQREPWKAYDIDEVDALLAEKDEEIAELKTKLASARLVLRLNKPEALYSNLETMSRLNHEIDDVERRERHQKYKRCLAMARWCESEAYIHEYGSEYDEDLVAWFGKWHKRWLELAKKFKEAK